MISSRVNISKLGTFLGRCLGKVNIAIVYLCSFILLFMTFAVTFDIVARYLFNKPTTWVVEVTQYGLLFLAFWPAAWILSEDGHIKIDIVETRLSGRKRKTLRLIYLTFSFIYCLIILILGSIRTYETIVSMDRLNSALQPYSWPLYLGISIGALLLVFQSIRGIVIVYRDLRA